MGGRGLERTELASGLLLLALGIFVYLEAGSYRMGSLTNIGPGMFPRALGVILVVCGLGTLIASFTRAAPLPAFKWRAAAALTVALLFFALTVNRFGIVVAVIGMTLIARLAEPDYRLPGTLALAVVLAVLSWLVFIVGLGFPLRAFRWTA